MPDPASIADKQRTTSRSSLGVEEEFHLVDLASRRLTPRAHEVLERLKQAPARSSGEYAAELQQSVVETNTAVTSSLSELRDHLLALRRELSTTAESLGVGVAAAGTMPLSAPLVMTETPRFRRMLADYQLLVREQLICGMQVHVGIDDRDVAVQLLDRVSPWLPPLLALSASSPFAHDGNDTGYASTRTLLWSRWPTTGRAGAFSSAAEYDSLVERLIASGVITDPGMLYFDVRPSAHVPTLELRICDACTLVDDVVLIAGLFRAIVARELGRLHAGQPSTAQPAAIERAAMWRAARSGLEGELVDLSGPRSVPAPVLVRGLITELRPELEAHGDYEDVRELGEGALARGSSAARQREVFRRREQITDVVDRIVAETRGAGPPTHAGARAGLLDAYVPAGHDEALEAGGSPRATHARALQQLEALGAPALRERANQLSRSQLASGVLFKAAGEERARAFPIDLCPRVLSTDEWRPLQAGVLQRARALDAFLQDIYAEAAVVRDGRLPNELVQGSPGFRSTGHAPPPRQRRVHVAGFDIIRDAQGRWLVLEDNVRVPSGVGFAITSRRLLSEALPELFGGLPILDPEQAPALLLRTLQQSAPPRVSSDRPRVVLLSGGPNDPAYFEHDTLARAMDVPLLRPSELLVSDDAAWHVDSSGRRSRVDVIYLRMDEQLSFQRGADGKVLGPELVSAVRAETLTLANALGNGVADNKAIYPYVPALIRYYLGEEPLLGQVPTLRCSDPEERGRVLDRLGELVLKPVDGYGGQGVVVGPQASSEELEHVRSLIEQQPAHWIAQETVQLSTHPTFAGDQFEPRHVDLRVFVYYGDQPVVAPAALTRVAPAGSLIVNSSRGGGGKDTWLPR